MLKTESIAAHELSFNNARILVVGDIMLDEYWHGDTERISPEAPIPVLKVKQSEHRLGGAANTALNIKRLGASVTLAGVIGQDEAAETMLKLAQDEQIDTITVKNNHHPTTRKLRLLSQNQQMLRTDFEKPLSLDQAKALTDLLVDKIGAFDAILLSDYDKGALLNCQPLIAAAKEQQIPVLVDPKGDDFERYHGATLLTPNLKEFETIMGPCQSQSMLIEKGQMLLSTLDLQALLITLSENGMLLCFAHGEHLHIHTAAKTVFDVTGAGDTVIATLTAAIANGYSLNQATQLANTAAGIVVGKMGAAQVSALDLQLAFQQPHLPQKIMPSCTQLMQQIQFDRGLGKKVVFTNGCFDILHKGHVSYLSEAKALGDFLVVAVNSDESIKALKGENRPINSLDDRMCLLASLSCVDFVIPFYSDTPTELIEQLQPEFLVKGGDYNVKDVVGKSIVEAYGGTVFVLTLQQGKSTTEIIERIQQQ